MLMVHLPHRVTEVLLYYLLKNVLHVSAVPAALAFLLKVELGNSEVKYINIYSTLA